MRADAQRSRARILDATLDALASDPEASMAEIASRAGVVRATIYVHFPTREALIEAVTLAAMDDVAAVIAAAEPDQGAPAEALRRVVSSAWRQLGRYHALVAINTQLPHSELHAKHEPVRSGLQPLIERGQRKGAFRKGVPAAWHMSMILAIIHAASAEVSDGTVSEADAEAALIATILGAIG
jgi:TetR/AcrR family transcriptional regulator, mexCD-oprJ operon repressor